MDRTEEIKPQSNYKFVPGKIAQRCPVCNGFGTVKYGEKVCQACEGKGYVLVPAAQIEGETEHGLG